MTTIVQIGNSDNKLTQVEWAAFCQAVDKAVMSRTPNVYFHGFPHGGAPWQNACWVANIEDSPLLYLRADLRTIARQFRQDSIALTVGTTEFVTPTP